MPGVLTKKISSSFDTRALIHSSFTCGIQSTWARSSPGMVVQVFPTSSVMHVSLNGSPLLCERIVGPQRAKYTEDYGTKI